MALTYTRVATLVAGNERTSIVDILADATYIVSGGYTLANSDAVAMTGKAGATVAELLSFTTECNLGGYEASLDRTSGSEKLKFLLGSAEATTTISSKTVRARVGFGYVNHK